jgi:hypothetical protein
MILAKQVCGCCLAELSIIELSDYAEIKRFAKIFLNHQILLEGICSR